MNIKQMSETVDVTLNGPKLPKAIKKLRAKPVYAPVSDDPTTELRRLVRQHKALTKSAVAISNITSDKTAQQDIFNGEVLAYKKGETIPNRLPVDAQAEGKILSNAYKKKASALASSMLKELKEIPIYRDFLSKVFIAKGPIVSAYLVSEINIHLGVKPSNIRRFCGLAVVNGQLERRTKGKKNAYSSEMRVRIYQIFNTLWKLRYLSPNNKYLKIWDGYRDRIEHSERVTERGTDKEGVWTGKIELSHPRKTRDGKIYTHVSARGYAHSYGWHKAADVFLEDLYTVWRAMEGLPVWPSYYAAKLGYEHGGKISVNAPKMLSVQDALDLVGPDVYGEADVDVDEVDMETIEALDCAAE